MLIMDPLGQVWSGVLIKQLAQMLAIAACDWGDVVVAHGVNSVTKDGSFVPLHSDRFAVKDCSFSIATSWGADGQREIPSGGTVPAAVVQQNCARPVLRHGGHRGAG